MPSKIQHKAAGRRAAKSTVNAAQPKTAKRVQAAKRKPKAQAAKRKPKAQAAKRKPKAQAAKRKPKAPAAKRKPKAQAAKRKPKVVLLSGGNPQIAKADGDAPVQAYIAAMPGWKRDLGKRLDALIVRTVPDVQKAVKWNSPLYGIEGRGWFLGIHVFAKYVKLAFFRGASLRPVPPDPSKDKHTRYVNLHEGNFDEAQLARWVRQAAALPGWVP